MPKFQPMQHVVSSPRVLSREVDAELVFLDLRTETYLGLDDVGLSMWQALTRAPTIEAAYQELLERYEVEADKLHDDLGSFVEDLERRGLIEVRAGARA